MVGRSNIKIGFTGTKKGVTRDQHERFKLTLSKYNGVLHHGDCIGADDEAHSLALFLKMPIVIHPPNNCKSRAFCGLQFPNKMVTMVDPKPYLNRNHDIVDACDILIATPKQHEEVLRSGTWATIRYARKTGKKIIIIGP